MPWISQHGIGAKVTKSRKGIFSRDTQGSNLEEDIKENIEDHLEVKIYKGSLEIIIYSS